jgi:hypothetical protein
VKAIFVGIDVLLAVCVSFTSHRIPVTSLSTRQPVVSPQAMTLLLSCLNVSQISSNASIFIPRFRLHLR